MASLDEYSQIPLLSKTEIVKRTEELLDNCWDGVFPIDVEIICDYLGISILPVQGLENGYHIDAFISSDFRTIYVDEREYVSESPRYRFSLAHELGHLLLHREYYSCRVDSFEEWRGLAQNFLCDYVEYQANYFAANLLAPENALIKKLDDEFNGSFVRDCWSKSHAEFRIILRNVRRFFMVSEQVVARRMRDTIFGADKIDEIAALIQKI